MSDIKRTDTVLPNGQVVRNGKTYGCHCDLEEGQEPDGCVIQDGNLTHCIFAYHRRSRWTCKEWRVVRPHSTPPHGR